MQTLAEALRTYKTDDLETKELIDRLLHKIAKWRCCDVSAEILMDCRILRDDFPHDAPAKHMEEQSSTLRIPAKISVFVRAASPDDAIQRVYEIEGVLSPAKLEVSDESVLVIHDAKVNILSVREIRAVKARIVDLFKFEARCPVCGVMNRASETPQCPHYIGYRVEDQRVYMYFDSEAASDSG